MIARSTAADSSAAARGRSALLALVALQPSPPRFAAALTGGVAMLLAIGLPTLAGHEDFGLLASAGALSALYLGPRSRHERARRLPVVQLALLAAAAAGALSAAQPVLAAVTVAAVTSLAAAAVIGLRLGPPGALFVVLITGIAQRLTAPASQGGAGLAPGVLLAGVALGAALAYVVVVAPLVVPSVRRRDAVRPIVSARFRLGPSDRVLLTRIVVGVVLATAVGGALGLHRSYWVVVAAISVLQATLGRRRAALRGAHRFLGTVGGAAIFAALAALHPQGLLLALIVSLLQFLVELVVVRHYGVALLLITPLALTIAEAGAGGDVGPTVRDRIVDTLAGVLVAGVVLVVEVAVDRRRRSRHASAPADERAPPAAPVGGDTTTGAERPTPDSPGNR